MPLFLFVSCYTHLIETEGMCGIFGAFSLSSRPLPPIDVVASLEAIRHRGPDDDGVWSDSGTLLGTRRLSIIDPERGHQPMTNESGTLHIVMNGEIFGYESLLAELEGRGYRFRSHCDTEVALNLFEQSREEAIERIDGQYAIALHDAKRGELLLLRDRTGIAPLFYCVRDSVLFFASEMKALFAGGRVQPHIDARSLDAVTGFGCIPPPRTLFEGVYSLPAGHYLVARRRSTAPPRDVRHRVGSHTESAENIHVVRYWDIPYPAAGQYENRTENEWAEDFYEILEHAVHRRLRSDVPVGLYLSGGIDSASVGALVHGADGVKERVFSIGFPERRFDETTKTQRLARFLSLNEQYLRYSQSDLARDLPRLVFHAESPLISTESVPLFALSGLAAKHVKVVLTGEGSDEALGGYDYFMRDAVFSRLDGGALAKLVRAAVRLRVATALGERNPVMPHEEELAWADEVFGFYPAGAIQMFYWKMIRTATYSAAMRERVSHLSDSELVELPTANLRSWDQLNRSLYVSSRVFLQGHLLAAHGDRALMAHSVEGRYPFLDRTVQEFLARVPPELKIRVIGPRTWEKYLLRRAMNGVLPREVLRRRKKPFLAPFGTPFAGREVPEYVTELLANRTLADYGYFDPEEVQRIRDRLTHVVETSGPQGSATPRLNRSAIRQTVDGMALAFVLSVQILEHTVRQTGYRYLPEDLVVAET